MPWRYIVIAAIGGVLLVLGSGVLNFVAQLILLKK